MQSLHIKLECISIEQMTYFKLWLVLCSICSYNPYDGPNDNPEVELPLTAGEYIYVYGDMDDDGFYEGEFIYYIFYYLHYLFYFFIIF